MTAMGDLMDFKASQEPERRSPIRRVDQEGPETRRVGDRRSPDTDFMELMRIQCVRSNRQRCKHQRSCMSVRARHAHQGFEAAWQKPSQINQPSVTK